MKYVEPSPERDIKMTLAVLKGYTLKQVGHVFGITGSRVRSLIAKVCFYHAKNIYDECGGQRYKGKWHEINTRKLRTYRNRLITVLTSDKKGGDICV